MNDSEMNRILLTGVPGAMTSPYDANFAARPNGPILKDELPVPHGLRTRINHALRFMFNPADRTVNLGMHIIGDNLGRDLEHGSVDVIDYPDGDEVLSKVKETWFDVVGISVGAEPLIVAAKEFAAKIRSASINRNVRIVFGNYGAASGKIAGVLTESDGEVLWDRPAERAEKASKGEPYYIGEGVRDMREYVSHLGIPLRSKPEDPVHSPMVPDNVPAPKSNFKKQAEEWLGVHGTPRKGGVIAVAVGCPNKCYFCNTTRMFGNRKLELLKTPQEIFDEMCRFQDAQTENDDECMPGISVTIMDENFTRPIQNLLGLCKLIRESERDIRFMIFGDIAELHTYLKTHGDFRELVRGGLSAIWLGIESKRDFFKKRGDASPEDVEKIVKAFQELGVIVIGSFIVGLPIHTEGKSTDELENIHEAFAWSRSLDTAGYQVVTETFTHIVDTRKAEPVGAHSQEDWGHVRTNERAQHPHIPIRRLGELDSEFRENSFLENGPMGLKALLTLWDGYKALRNSTDRNDLRMAEYYYWTAKHFAGTASIATAFSTLPVFKQHSEDFLQRLAVFFDEIDHMPPPAGPNEERHKTVFEDKQKKTLDFVRFVEKRLRRRFVVAHGAQSQ